MSERRGVVKLLGGVLMVAIGGALTVPAAVFYTGPARRKRESDAAIDVTAVERLPEGVPVRVALVAKRRLDAWTAFTDVTLGAAWLVRQGDSVRALSTVCPHAGCSIDWEAAKQCFACPCHGSVFAPSGERTAGPSPRAMDPLDVEVKEGRVLVAYKRFRQGVSDREPIT